ncbi:hypothetical protein HG535_0E01530 [Zygotorulaspora mrakii]|uniref:alpha-1,2-Mannosidase n=1 Tax=Zygotorulaspora mrakii TaxID=42260 RepID=A0A7H9B521_ZYGMR|nr:uncharacterized protein HG535_0E01530 [Zygotorulaspora mrakii]QLG73069.1 hypothetical protein HG535_0E01530 [Zygotorulaspora mrakii]
MRSDNILKIWLLGAISTALVAIGYLGKQKWTTVPQYGTAESVRNEIEEAFLESWRDYEDYAWGYDVYGPLSHSHRNMPRSGDPLGWITIDALDTMLLMFNKTTSNRAEFLKGILEIQVWTANELNYNIDAEVNIFETTIRMLGGLLSAYHYTKQLKIGNPEIYLNKSIDLCDRLAIAFKDRESGIPFSSVNLQTGEAIRNHVNEGASSTAEFTTLQLEFKYLSYLTGNATYWNLAENVYPALYDTNDLLSRYRGLAPIYTQPDSGLFHGQNIRFGSRGDSFYEYLLKQYLQSHEKIYYDLYRESMEGMKKYLIAKSIPSGFTYIGERPYGLQGALDPKMDHLVCFMGGLLGMGATEGLSIKKARKQSFWDSTREEDWKLAQELTHTCYQMYRQIPSGLSPEIVVFNDGITKIPPHAWSSPSGDFFVKPADKHNLQRPETVESIMFLYHLTKDEKYRQWGYEILSSFKEHTSVVTPDSRNVFVSLGDCISLPTHKRDNMESFWLAETLKYLYLLFEDDLDLTSIVFNTEAHPFPVFDLERLDEMHLKTNWSPSVVRL